MSPYHRQTSHKYGDKYKYKYYDKFIAFTVTIRRTNMVKNANTNIMTNMPPLPLSSNAIISIMVALFFADSSMAMIQNFHKCVALDN